MKSLRGTINYISRHIEVRFNGDVHRVTKVKSIHSINKHILKCKMYCMILGLCNFKFRYKSDNAVYYGGTYNTLLRFYRIKGYTCELIEGENNEFDMLDKYITISKNNF